MIKRIILLLAGIFFLSSLFAQFAAPVTWNFSAKKIAPKTYELHMTATISDKYHLYAQNNNAEGPVPTTFTFVKNPLLDFQGKVKEKGRLISKLETVWGFKVNYFENKVDFLQVIRSKVTMPVTVKGTVNFMVCDDKKCFPPKDVDFEIKIGGK